MRHAEQAELERQGAKAAARGDDARSNPLLRNANLPPQTGESTQEWASRRDAWKAGYEWQRQNAPDDA